MPAALGEGASESDIPKSIHNDDNPGTEQLR